MSQTNETILLIDANALIHRAYHAFPKNLSTKDGELVNAVYGFARLLFIVLKQYKPKYIVCAYDTHAPTFRHKLFAEYKGTRKKTDDELINQFPKTLELLNALNIPSISKAGFEADDIIGTLSRHKELENVRKIVVTGDRDLLQLIDDDTEVLLAGTSFSKSKLYNPENVIEKIGFPADMLVDFKGLRGDSSDNIPGVRGVGDKTATDLIKKYHSIANVYEHIDELKNAVKNRLTDNRDIAELSKELATIKLDMNIDFKLEDATVSDYDEDEVYDLFMKYEFKSLLKDLPKAKLKDVQLNTSSSETKEGTEDQLGLLASNEDLTKDLKFEKFDNTNITKLIEILMEIDSFAIRTYASNEKVFTKPDAIAFADGSKVLFLDCKNLSKDAVEALSRLVDSEKSICAYDAKRDIHRLMNLGFKDPKINFDVMLAAYLLGAGSQKIDFESIAFNETGVVLKNKLTENIDSELAYSASLVWGMYSGLSVKLEKSEDNMENGWGLKKLFYELEMPVVDVLIAMERNGIMLDTDYLRNYSDELDSQIADITKEIQAEVGYEFNIASPKQVGEALFEKLGLPGVKRTKSGGYATNEKVLRNLKDTYPIIDKILTYREISKLRSTYTEALIALVNSDTKKIHSTFRQAVAATGRLASSNPNLQNIPISSEAGLKIRKAFVASPGKAFILIDYSQQELRLLAHFSQEPMLIKAFSDGEDIHALTAAKIFEKSPSEVTKSERRVGKTVNFGVVYGISAFGLSEGLQVSREDAQKFIDAFYESYPKVRTFFDNLLDEAKTKGFIRTIMGRMKDTKSIRSSNYQLRSGAEREIINFPLQGSAADMMKLAMIQVNNLVNENYSDSVKIILQIHDELVFEIDNKKLSGGKLASFCNDVKGVMLKVLNLDLPMRVDIDKGVNLTDIKRLKT